MTDEMKTYGQIAYEAYAEVIAAAAGETPTPWDDLDHAYVNAFMAAGRAVDEQVRTDGIDVRSVAPSLDTVLAAIDRFEAQLGFTAPELWGDRIDELRSHVRGIFEPAAEDQDDDEDDEDETVTPLMQRDLLLLAGEDIPVAAIESWTAGQAAEVTTWAATEHLAASDNHVTRLPRPSVLDAKR